MCCYGNASIYSLVDVCNRTLFLRTIKKRDVLTIVMEQKSSGWPFCQKLFNYEL